MFELDQRAGFAQIALTLTLLSGCGKATQTVGCQVVCSNYKTCIRYAVDGPACRDRCDEQREAEDAFSDQVQRCARCLDDRRACAETSKECEQCEPVFEWLFPAEEER